MGDRMTFFEVRFCDDALARDPYLQETFCSAFTVAELGEMLPPEYLTMRLMSWSAFNGDGEFMFSADTEADARAKMLVYLLENKLITLP